MGSRALAQLIVLFHVIVIFGCARGETRTNERYRETRMMMGTIVHLDVCRSKRNSEHIGPALQDAWERLEDIAWRMNVLDERSDVAKINSSALTAVSVERDTYQLLQTSLDYSRVTDGAFDITVWPLIQLWRENERNNVLPSPEQIQAVQSAVGPDNIQLLSEYFVRLRHERTKIDLGGIAKGYALDEAARILRGHGIKSFYLDAGGDIYVEGLNCSGKPWRIGIRDPRDQSKIIDIIELSNGAVTTSGDYEQHFIIQNQRWSHIINPVTGYPQKDVMSATVIASDATTADVLATALCVLGSRRGTDYINSLGPNYASLIIVSQDSRGIETYTSRTYRHFRAQP